MNDDAIPGSAADLPPTQDDVQGTETTSQGNGRQGGSRRRSQSRARTAKAALAKKLRFMTDLMNSLDMLVFAELCTLYYME